MFATTRIPLYNMHCKVDSIMKAIDKIVTMITLKVLQDCDDMNKNWFNWSYPPRPTMRDVKSIRRGLLSYIEIAQFRRSPMVIDCCSSLLSRKPGSAKLMNNHIMLDLIRRPSGFTQKAALKIIYAMYSFHVTSRGIYLPRPRTMIRLTSEYHNFVKYTAWFLPWDASQENRHV